MFSRRRLRRAASIVAIVAAPLALTAFAVVNPGVPVAKVELNDGGVWLTSTAAMKLGRYNHQVEELNGGLVAVGTPFDVLQDGGTVLLQQANTIVDVDPATVTAGASALLPAKASVSLGGGVVSVFDPASGSLWARPASAVGGLRTEDDRPDLKPGQDGAAVTATDGTVLALSSGGAVSRLSVTDTARTVSSAGSISGSGKPDAATAVGDSLYILRDGRLSGTEGSVDLSGYGSVLSLQQPGPASDTVLVSTPVALLRVNVGSGSITVIDAGASGTPAAPVYVAGCALGAWASGKTNSVVACDGEPIRKQTLDGVGASTQHLVFRVNRDVAVLNDTESGRLWMPLKDTHERKPDWGSVAAEQPKDKQDQQDDPDTAQVSADRCAPDAGPPTAEPDAFGVRPGRTRILPVLTNDGTADCSVLSVSEVDPLPADFGTVSTVDGGRALQVAVSPQAAGSATISYTITDGRGNSTPATSTVTLTVHPDSENAAPVQLRESAIVVEQGAEASVGVLPDWSDPDGDELVLAGASTDSGATVQTRADGTVTVAAGGVGVGRQTVTVSVSDGRETTQGTLALDVRAPGSVVPTIDPQLVTTHTDTPVTVSPLASVRSASAQPLRLASVDQVAGATVTPDLEDGTFTVSSARPGTYYVPITVVAMPQQATGFVRVDVLDWPSASLPPQAVVDRALLPAGGETTIDPLANDVDPSGGVLVLESVERPDVPGLKLAMIDHRTVQITATRALTAPVVVGYTVSNGAGQAAGQIVIVQSPPGASQLPPIVHDVDVTVRTGGVVTIPVLQSASDPEGEPLTVAPALVEAPASGQGLLFVSGNVLRFQAPTKPGTVTAVFAVSDPEGNTTSGRVTIRVHKSDPEKKAPADPKPLTARVIAGETVRIPVPLTGIDADGDGVTLLGPDNAPAKGRITSVGADYLEYQALPDESGTDEFRYAVQDWIGQRSVATVRVGIAPRAGATNTVVARDDTLVVRPGVRVEARVLANDTDSSGDGLTLSRTLEKAPGVSATVSDDRIVVDAPRQQGTVLIGYTVEDGRGGRDTATLAVTTSADAPYRAPIARDVVVSPRDTINKRSVDVDVLAFADNPSGPLSDLAVSVHPSAAGIATVTAGGSVRVTLQDEQRTIPFLITNTAQGADRIGTYAFITVPARGDFPPMLRPNVKEIRVAAGKSVRIPIAEYVMVGPGKTARVYDHDSVSATRSDGSSLIQDDTTLVYTAAADSSGPASISFTVSDGSSRTDPKARVQNLTIPIRVVSDKQRPPEFSSASVSVAPGEDPVRISLKALTTSDDPDATFSYRLSAAAPSGFTASLSGNTLTVGATASARRGTSGVLSLKIGYGKGETVDAQVPLEVVASTKRLAAVRDVTITDGEPGKTRSVNVLDGALNPFPGTPLRVVGARVDTPGAGTATVSGDSVAVTPGASFTGQLVVRFAVRDATDDPDREVEGRILVTVAGKPARPGTPQITASSSGRVSLRWQAPAANGAVIDSYRVTASDGTQLTVDGNSTQADLSGLTNGTPYTFTVEAHNAAGWSDPSAPSSSVTPDARPGTVSSVSLSAADGSVTASWDTPSNDGSPLTGYSLLIAPAPAGIPGGLITSDVWENSRTIAGLSNGTAYTVSVSARNASAASGPWSDPSPSAVPFGAPGKPTLTAIRVDQPSGGAAQVTWAPGALNGARERYSLMINTTTNSGVDLGTTGGTVVVGGLANGATFSLTIVATSRGGQTSSDPATVSIWGAPAASTFASVTSTPSAASGAGNIDATWNPPGDTGGGAIDHYTVSLLKDGTMISTGDTGTTTQSFGGLTAGSYAISVVACTANACGPVATSDPVSVVTKPGAIVVQPTVTQTDDQFEVVPAQPADWGGAPSQHIEWQLDGDTDWTTMTGDRFSFTLPDGQTSATVRYRAVTDAGAGPVATVTVPVP